MRKFIYTLFVSLLLLGCNPNNNTPADSWKFEIVINGETHKAEGGGWYADANYCYGSNIVQLGIGDQSASSYISGNTGNAQIQFSNTALGTQELSLFYSSWAQVALDDYIVNGQQTTSLDFGYSLTPGGQMLPGTMGGLKLPITITDLGTAGNGTYSGGAPMKANYSGTIYLADLTSSPLAYNKPMTIVISFESLRL